MNKRDDTTLGAFKRAFLALLLVLCVCCLVVVAIWARYQMFSVEAGQSRGDECWAKGGESVWNSETHRLLCIKRDALIQ